MLPTILITALLVALPVSAVAHTDSHAKKAGAAISTEEKAFGRQGDPKKVSRTINVDMADTMRFTPAELAIKRGETIRFVVKNKGQVLHEMVISTKKELEEHALRSHPTLRCAPRSFRARPRLRPQTRASTRTRTRRVRRCA